MLTVYVLIFGVVS